MLFKGIVLFFALVHVTHGSAQLSKISSGGAALD